MFTRHSGKTKVIHLPVTASTAIAKGTLVAFSSGLLIAATSSTAAGELVGVLNKTIATTDSDYAVSGRLVPVEVPVEKNTEWKGDVTSGLVSTDIGAEVDLTSGTHVNRGATSVKVAKALSVISTTKGIFQIKFGGAY